MHQKPKVSFLILNWNGLSYTKQCVRSLLKTTYPNFEIVIIDNASDNEEFSELKSCFKNKIKIYKTSKNLGYAEGMNFALTKSKGAYIMLLNNDMEFDKGWINYLTEVLINNPDVGACQPKIRDMKEKGYFEYAAAAGGFIDVFGYPFARGRIFSNLEKDTGQYDKPVDICWGGVLLIRRKIINQIKLFDPIYVNYAEDIDLSLRIWSMGYRIVYEPRSVVYHFGGAALNKDMAKKMYFIHRNHLILILKNWHILSLLIIYPIRVLFDVIAIIYYLFNHYPEFSVSVIRAHASLICELRKIYSVRKSGVGVLAYNSKLNTPIYKGSIVLDYFLFKKRIFSQIIKS